MFLLLLITAGRLMIFLRVYYWFILVSLFVRSFFSWLLLVYLYFFSTYLLLVDFCMFVRFLRVYYWFIYRFVCLFARFFYIFRVGFGCNSFLDR